MYSLRILRFNTLDGFTHSMSNIAFLVTAVMVVMVVSPFFNSQKI